MVDFSRVVWAIQVECFEFFIRSDKGWKNVFDYAWHYNTQDVGYKCFWVGASVRILGFSFGVGIYYSNRIEENKIKKGQG